MYSTIINKDWKQASVFDFTAQLFDTPQDPVHHAEGNVGIHTQLVLAELEASALFQQLNTYEQTLLWAAAWLHDIGKVNTTVTEADGSISAPGHARIGAMMARQLMYRDGGIPFELREKIVGLIRYHGLPLWIFEKPDPVKTLVQCSLEVDTKLLSLLARADIMGRSCEDKEALLYRIDCFDEFCKEQDCWGVPRHFESAHARVNFLTKENGAIDYVPFEQPAFRVIMLSGLPGAGKDFYLRKIKDLPVISLDQIRRHRGIEPTDKSGNGRVIQEGKELARKYMRNQQSFVWNATNITRQMRMQLTDLFLTYKACVEVVYIETPYQRLINQNKSREEVVPVAALERLIDKLEVPVLWEAHEVKYVTGE